MSRVLVVHADEAVGDAIAAKLSDEAKELSARVVTSGERAMDSFIQEPADVLVIDYHLEGRDGVSTAEAIRWMPGGRRARVILTAEHDPEDGALLELGRSVDAFATLVGPLDLKRVSAQVRRAAAVRPHEAETRVLSTEQALLSAERARAGGAYDDVTSPSDEAAVASLSVPISSASAALGLDDETLDEPPRAAWEWTDGDGRAEGREVRALAEATHRAHSDLVGSFERMPFAKLLGRLAEKRGTGALICVHPPDERATTEGTEPTKVVYFRAGVPVHVRSNLVSECLGHVLARQRKIGKKTLEESVSAVQRGEGRQGEVLVKMGALSPLELSEALATQLRTKIFELFAWQRGTFRFAADRKPPRELIDLELGLAEIVYRGVRLSVSPAHALELLEPGRDRYVVPEARHMVRFLELSADEPTRELIRRIDGSRRLAELLQSAPDPGAAAQLLHAMQCLDAVRLREEPLRPISLDAGGSPSSRPRPNDADPSGTWLASLPSVPSAAVPAPSDDVEADEQTDEETADGGDPGDAEAEVRAIMEGAVDALGDEDDGRATIPEPDSGPSDVTRLEGARRNPDDATRMEPSPLASEEPSAPDALDDRVDRLLRAERHFRRGQRALERDRPEDAVKPLSRAAELCPEEPQFLAFAAYARHAAAPGDAAVLEAALDDVERACEQAKEDADAHLFRGRMLAAAGREEEARRAFARVLELVPDHAEAREKS